MSDYVPVPGGRAEGRAIAQALPLCRAIASTAGAQLDRPDPAYDLIWVGLRASVGLILWYLDQLAADPAGSVALAAHALDQWHNCGRLVLLGLDRGPDRGRLLALKHIEIALSDLRPHLARIRDIRKDQP